MSALLCVAFDPCLQAPTGDPPRIPLWGCADEFRPAERLTNYPLRLCVSDVFKTTSLGTTIAGKLETGKVCDKEKVCHGPLSVTQDTGGGGCCHIPCPPPPPRSYFWPRNPGPSCKFGKNCRKFIEPAARSGRS